MRNVIQAFTGAFIAGMLMVSCLESTGPSKPAVKSSWEELGAAEELAAHTRHFDPAVYQVAENVWSAVGYGLANSVMIEGEDGLIIVDTMESQEQARQVMAEFRKISDKPVKAIIYTHNHADHIMGAMEVAGEDRPVIYAHQTLDAHVQRVVNKMRPIITARSARMFGNYLDEKGLENAGVGPFLGMDEQSTTGYLMPTHTFSDKMDIEAAGLRIQLIHAPGETDDHIYVLLPDQQLLVCGDNFYRSFPNLYTIRGTRFRGFKQWYEAVDLIREIRPEYLIPSHGRPLTGQDHIFKVATDYRDAIQFIHDQGIRGINMGMTPDQLAGFVALPDHLARSPYLQEFYGSVSWSLRALFAGNLGWFSGDAADLNPLSPIEKAELISDLSGGVAHMVKAAQNYNEKEQYQSVLRISGYILTLEPSNKAAKALRVKALKALGEKEKNANARHYYLTEALEIQNGFVASLNVGSAKEQVSQFPLEGFFSLLSVSLDPEKAGDTEKTIAFEFTDVGEIFTIHLRKGVAEISRRLPDKPDIHVLADSTEFKLMLSKEKSPIKVLAGFDYEKGNAISLGLFLKLFKSQPQKLAFSTIVAN